MINPQCKVCQHLQKHPDSLDWSMTNAALSLIVDVSKDSIRRHRKHAEDPELITGGPESTESVPGGWIPRRRWDKADGSEGMSWQFVPSGPEDVQLDNERIDSLVLDWPEPDTRDFTGGTELALSADLQLGKSEGGVGTDDTIAKFYASIEAVAQRWEMMKPVEGYLCDLGDLIENIASTSSQVGTNDRTVPEQVEDAVAVYMNAIGRLKALTGTLYFATVTSNHGEARTSMKTNPYDSENDWGLAIQRIIQGKCEDRGWDVQFIRPAKYEDTAEFTTQDGTKIAITHGHHSGSPAKMKTWITNQIVGHRPGHAADMWFAGHYHHFYHFPIGDGTDVFGTPSLDPGSAWFTKKSGESSRQGIVAVTVDQGNWSNLSIL